MHAYIYKNVSVSSSYLSSYFFEKYKISQGHMESKCWSKVLTTCYRACVGEKKPVMLTAQHVDCFTLSGRTLAIFPAILKRILISYLITVIYSFTMERELKHTKGLNHNT